MRRSNLPQVVVRKIKKIDRADKRTVQSFSVERERVRFNSEMARNLGT